jgi:hypothetical protein
MRFMNVEALANLEALEQLVGRDGLTQFVFERSFARFEGISAIGPDRVNKEVCHGKCFFLFWCVGVA